MFAYTIIAVNIGADLNFFSQFWFLPRHNSPIHLRLASSSLVKSHTYMCIQSTISPIITVCRYLSILLTPSSIRLPFFDKTSHTMIDSSSPNVSPGQKAASPSSSSFTFCFRSNLQLITNTDQCSLFVSFLLASCAL